MSKETILVIVGVLIVLSPFLGLPQSWLSLMLPILGLVVIVVAYLAMKGRRNLPEA